MSDEEVEQYGKAFQFEPEFQGPTKHRKSTDVACIYLFGVFMLLWLCIGTFAFVKGDLREYMRASSTDSKITDTKNDEYDRTANRFSEDLKHGIGYMIAAFIVAIISTIIYIGVMRWVASVVVWLSLIIVCVALLAVGSTMMYLYGTNKGRNPDDRNMFLAVGIVCFVCLAIYLAFLYFMRNRIRLAIALIKESSKAIGDMFSTLFFPIVPSLVQMLVFVFGIAVVVYLGTFGEPTYKIHGYTSMCQCTGPASGYGDNTACQPDVFQFHCSYCAASCVYDSNKLPVIIQILHGLNVFGMYWALFFIYAFVEMVLAGAFATWYWTMPKSNLESAPVMNSFKRTCRYHLGTIAFGSLIITLIRMIRLLLDSLHESLRKSDNGAARLVAACFECIFEWLENIMRFINRNAYILTAVHGYNFCKSAKTAFSLILRNIVNVYVLDTVADALFGLSKVLLTICVSSLSYVMFAYMSSHQFEYIGLLVLIVALFTYLVATLFFDVFSMAVDTLFVCYLEDRERNDGTAERPYYMSQKLSKIFEKKADEEHLI